MQTLETWSGADIDRPSRWPFDALKVPATGAAYLPIHRSWVKRIGTRADEAG